MPCLNQARISIPELFLTLPHKNSLNISMLFSPYPPARPSAFVISHILVATEQLNRFSENLVLGNYSKNWLMQFKTATDTLCEDLAEFLHPSWTQLAEYLLKGQSLQTKFVDGHERSISCPAGW
jgi:hypothetical protein